MGVVIRPSAGVFRRTMPMVIVFGAYRRIDIEEPLSDAELDTITGVVDLARRYHTPLAFSRAVSSDIASEPGVWLPGCRPRIMDRVFDHEPGSAFRNSDFSGVLNSITKREVCVTGPQCDSSLRATVSEMNARGDDVSVITDQDMMHLCSAAVAWRLDDDENATNCNTASDAVRQGGCNSADVVFL